MRMGGVLRQIQRLLIFTCSAPWRATGYLGITAAFFGATFVLYRAIKGVMAAKIALYYFIVGGLLPIIIFFCLLMLAIAIPLGYSKVRFTLSNALIFGIPQLHLPKLGQVDLKIETVLQDLVATVSKLDEEGVHRIKMTSPLLGKSVVRRNVKHRIESELCRHGLNWRVQDEGECKRPLAFIFYWLWFVLVLRIYKYLVATGTPQPYQRQPRRKRRSLMVWGTLTLRRVQAKRQGWPCDVATCHIESQHGSFNSHLRRLVRPSSIRESSTQASPCPTNGILGKARLGS